GTGDEDRRFAVYAACHPSSSFRSRAAAAGSSAEVIARTTTARFAPASRISSRRAPAAIPPMANQGLPASAATSVRRWRPTACRVYRAPALGAPRTGFPALVAAGASRDPGDGEPGFARLGGDFGQQLGAHGPPAGFRRILPHRADAEVVDFAVGFGGERLVPRMGGAAEDHIVSEHGPGLSAGEVPLADVEDVA